MPLKSTSLVHSLARERRFDEAVVLGLYRPFWIKKLESGSEVHYTIHSQGGEQTKKLQQNFGNTGRSVVFSKF